MPTSQPSGQVLVQLGYPGDSEASSQAINILGKVVHDSSVITSSFNHWTTFSNFFTTEDPRYVDGVLNALSMAAVPTIFVRVGQPNSAGATQWGVWQQHILQEYRAIYKTSGHVIRVDTSDRLFELARASKTIARTGLVSDIVVAIAKENGLDTLVEQTKGSWSYIQTQQSDYDFIVNRLIVRAQNEAGQANYRFFVRDNVLHFHTVGYQASIRQIDYLKSPGTELVEVDQAPKLVGQGGSGVRLITHDMYAGMSNVVAESPEKALRYANRIPKTANVDGGSKFIRYHLGPNGDAEAEAIAQHYYESQRAGAYQVEISLERAVNLRLNDVIWLTVSSGVANSPWTGYYNLMGVTHSIRQGTISSLLIMQRGECSGTATVGDDAPGQTLSASSFTGSKATGMANVLNPG